MHLQQLKAALDSHCPATLSSLVSRAAAGLARAAVLPVPVTFRDSHVDTEGDRVRFVPSCDSAYLTHRHARALSMAAGLVRRPSNPTERAAHDPTGLPTAVDLLVCLDSP